MKKLRLGFVRSFFQKSGCNIYKFKMWQQQGCKVSYKHDEKGEFNMAASINILSANNDFTAVAAAVLAGLGGKENVESLDNCITRLRLEVKDHTRVDETQIRSAGVAGVIRPSETAVQVVVGTKVQSIADELRKLLQ